MIQFNLLPDVKQEFIKAQRLKRMVIVSSIVVASFSIFITIMLFMVVNVYQRTQLSSVDKRISENSKKLKETENLDKILTIQNQLNNMTALHESKPAVSRLKDYISAVTPKDVTYAKIELVLSLPQNANVTMTENSLTFTGAADSLKTVNQFIDTLKITKYQVITENKDDSGKVVSTDKSEEKSAFSNVVLDTFGRDDKEASFTIKLNFDPAIFDNKTKVSLVVPEIITTRSVTERPTLNLFKPLSNTEEEEE